MVRRPYAESDESEDEVPTRVKSEKKFISNKGGVSQNNAYKLDSQELSGEDESQDENDDENEGDDDEDEQGGSRRERKRVRRDDDDQNDRREQLEMQQRPQNLILERDEKDGYVVGSIVRIKLYQFLTYEEAEFRPGPYLNMILGPNGTGKSSIACALCLGLNWPTRVLGRATRIGSFVKNDSNEPGFIEIELKGKIGGGNYVIKRHLARNMERQEKFTLNGDEVPGSKIKELVEGLGIQVNNLCSFLPQDKVVEFSQMTPQQLLLATEQAAGHKKLVEWHDTLIKEGQNLKKLTSDLEAEKKELAQHEQRNANLEKEVQAYKNRREIERRIELFELVLPVKDYFVSLSEYRLLKVSRHEAHKHVMDLKDSYEPVEQLKRRLEQKKEKAESERNKHKTLAREKFTHLKRIRDDNQKLQSRQNEVEDKLTALRREEKERKVRIEGIKKNIHKVEDEIANPPEIEDMSVIMTDLRSNDERRKESERHKHNLEGDIRPFVEESERQSRAKSEAIASLKKLGDISHRKLMALEKWDQNTGPVVHWLRENKHRFKMEVIEPAILSVDMKDRRFAAAVESAFSLVQLKTFVFQCQEDYKLFSEIVLDSEQLGKRYRVPTWFRDPETCKELPPPIRPEQLRSYGFDAYALDCVTYPKGMENFLKVEVNLHRFAIGLDANKINNNEAIKAMTTMFEGGRGGSGNFVAGSVLIKVTRSRYGARKPFSNTRDVPAARNLNTQAIPQEVVQKYEDAVKEAGNLFEAAEAEIKKIGHKISILEKNLNELSVDRRQIEARRKDVIEKQTRIQTLHRNLENFRKELTTLENAPSIAEKRAKLREELFDLAKRRMGIAKDLGKITRAAMKDHENATITGLQYIQQSANLVALEEKLKIVNLEYEKAMRKFNEIDAQFKEKKGETQRKLEICKNKINSVDAELRETYRQMEEKGEINDMDHEQVRTELSTLKAQLELNVSTNAGVIELYEKRQRMIEALQEKVERHETDKTLKERKIEKTKSKWYPALKHLVSNIGEKFSAAFERVGCAGEIQLGEHEDYAAWTIDILVKFRDTEKLQLLTGQRQSGGERALTTIMYLMSLTELSRTPFSLVDEINQGMDQLYERAVHNSLVEVTCREQSGQYFLITPKLLTDLHYHHRMKVLCVNNGEWLPEELNSGSLSRMLKTYVTKRGRQNDKSNN